MFDKSTTTSFVVLLYNYSLLTFSISPIVEILPNDDNVSFGNISLLAEPLVIPFNTSTFTNYKTDMPYL